MQAPSASDGLAAIPAGPALAAALHALPLPQLPNDRMLEVLTAQYRQLCHTQARMAALLTELTRCPGDTTPGQVIRTTEPDTYASEETRAALRWTRRSTDNEHELAESVVHGMPVLFGAWSAGVVDRPRVRVFHQYLTGLTTEQTDRICRVAVPRAPTLTTGQLAHLLRRMVIAIDPDAAARWYREGIRDRNVTAYPASDGTIIVTANGLPADQAEAACQRIQHLADTARRAGHPGPIGQIRCDLFLGLLDGRFHNMTTEQVIVTLITDYRPTGPAGATASDPHTRGPERPHPAGDDQPASGGDKPEPAGGPEAPDVVAETPAEHHPDRDRPVRTANLGDSPDPGDPTGPGDSRAGAEPGPGSSREPGRPAGRHRDSGRIGHAAGP